MIRISFKQGGLVKLLSLGNFFPNPFVALVAEAGKLGGSYLENYRKFL